MRLVRIIGQSALAPLNAMRASIVPRGRCLLILGTTFVIGAVGSSVAAQNRAVAPTASQIAVDGTLLSISVRDAVKRAPDIARLSAGVVTQASSPTAAMAANAEKMRRVIAGLEAAGVARQDLETSVVSLQPQYRYAENQPPTITGYTARNLVQITARNVAKLGELLDALVAVGANEIAGPSFEVENKEAAFDEARRAALAKAMARAQTYAKALEMRPKRIVSIVEGRVNEPQPMMAMARMEAADSTPIAPGLASLEMNLDVVFELVR